MDVPVLMSVCCGRLHNFPDADVRASYFNLMIIFASASTLLADIFKTINGQANSCISVLLWLLQSSPVFPSDCPPHITVLHASY